MAAFRFDRAHDLILKADLDPEQIRRQLQDVGIVDWQAAYKRLRNFAEEEGTRELLGECLPTLMSALYDAATPDMALICFERFVQSAPDREALFRYFHANPRAIEILIRIVVNSQFLAEILISNPDYLPRIAQYQQLAELKSREQFFEEADAAIAGLEDEEAQLDALRRLQRWELLRIGACDSFGLINLRAVTVQLSLLTDAMVQVCLKIAAERTRTDPAGFCVLAMGKLGGEELNYSSDIDLIFLSQEDSGRFWSLGQKLIRGLIHPTQSGFLYRVDMRLRPWGNSGPLVATVDSHLDYLRNKAMLWEKQAMLKARVIAGSFSVGQEFLKQAQQSLFTAPAADIRENVRGMKAKIEANLEQKGKKWGEVKSGTGSIRDVEFVAQYLQMIHGGENPQVRSFNTLDALIRLADFSYLHADEYRILTDGYIFLRKIEHQLQLLHNKQVHNLPTDALELDFLALRLDYQSGEQFLDYYEKHRQEIRRVYDRYLGDNPRALAEESDEIVSPGLKRHLERMDHEYSISFDDEEIELHARLAESLDDENPAVVEAQLQEGGDWLVTIVAYDYLGELSLICGLLFVHQLDIVDVDVFTYESAVQVQDSSPAVKRVRPKPGRNAPPPRAVAKSKEESRKKIVDVFLVRPNQPLTPETWFHYQQELRELLKLLQAGRQTEATGVLAKRVAAQLRVTPARDRTLYPVDIEIDNTRSEQFTLMSISAPDTIGFLYELANALAMNGVNIARVHFKSLGGHAYDLLYVTDQQGRKITDERDLQELRAATVLTKQFTHLLPNSPNPEAALTHFREFMAQFFGQPDWMEKLSSLERPEVLGALAKLLGISDFLWSDFLRMQHANLFPVLQNVEDLAIRKNKEELQQELAEELLAAEPGEPRIAALNSWKDRYMFRTDMRHILGHIPEFGQFSSELSDGAEVVVEAACRLVTEELQSRFGRPMQATGEAAPYTVCALGKCGGRELGYASDIELMFIYSGEGKTTGPEVITVTEYYIKLVEAVLQTIRTRHEGIFQVDLRLRPYGKGGPLAVSLEAFRTYFALGGPAWPYERQALVKLRPICGDLSFGKQISDLRDELIYSGTGFDTEAMRGMRERQLRQLVTPGKFNAKFSPGGLVDIEYLVQGLQMIHAHEAPEIKAPNTRAALRAMRDAGLLSEGHFQSLNSSCIFLRRLIDALRVVRGDAKDLSVPTPHSEEFQFLARRLGYEEDMGRLQQDLQDHASRVFAINQALLN